MCRYLDVHFDNSKTLYVMLNIQSKAKYSLYNIYRLLVKTLLRFLFLQLYLQRYKICTNIHSLKNTCLKS